MRSLARRMNSSGRAWRPSWLEECLATRRCRGLHRGVNNEVVAVVARRVDGTAHALERSKAVDLDKSLAPSMHSIAQRILHELHGELLQHLIIGLKHVLAHHLDSSERRRLPPQVLPPVAVGVAPYGVRPNPRGVERECECERVAAPCARAQAAQREPSMTCVVRSPRTGRAEVPF